MPLVFGWGPRTRVVPDYQPCSDLNPEPTVPLLNVPSNIEDDDDCPPVQPEPPPPETGRTEGGGVKVRVEGGGRAVRRSRT